MTVYKSLSVTLKLPGMGSTPRPDFFVGREWSTKTMAPQLRAEAGTVLEVLSTSLPWDTKEWTAACDQVEPTIQTQVLQTMDFFSRDVVVYVVYLCMLKTGHSALASQLRGSDVGKLLDWQKLDSLYHNSTLRNNLIQITAQEAVKIEHAVSIFYMLARVEDENVVPFPGFVNLLQTFWNMRYVLEINVLRL